jgi:tetratricopeptide (TPR) repeat protein
MIKSFVLLILISAGTGVNGKASIFPPKAVSSSLVGLGLLMCPVTTLLPLLEANAATEVGITEIQGETLKLFRLGLRLQQPGEDLQEAQRVMEQVVQVEPDFVYGWTNLGNVLTSLGNLDQATLCYNKAISLRPPPEALAATILNRASIELSTGKTELALRDLTSAERIAGSTPSIMTNKAVALSNAGDWEASAKLFDGVINSSEKNALPWWLRYSMALLETGRGAEAVGYYQRVLKSFPNETECKAFGAALYTFLGAPGEASNYWNRVSETEQMKYRNSDYMIKQLKWGPKAMKAMDSFLDIH